MNKKVGLVTTARVTHATPANVYAHSVWRGFESETTDGCTEQADIAQQVKAKNVSYVIRYIATVVVVLQGVSRNITTWVMGFVHVPFSREARAHTVKKSTSI